MADFLSLAEKKWGVRVESERLQSCASKTPLAAVDVDGWGTASNAKASSLDSRQPGIRESDSRHLARLRQEQFSKKENGPVAN